MHINSTPVNLSLLPQPPFSCHPRRFTSQNSAPSLQELLQKISLSMRGGGVRPNPTNSLDPPLVVYYLYELTMMLIMMNDNRNNNNWIVLDVEPSTGTVYTFARKMHFVNKWFSIIFDLVVTLIFDRMTSKSTQFIYVPECTEVVNLMKFPEAVCEFTRLFGKKTHKTCKKISVLFYL